MKLIKTSQVPDWVDGVVGIDELDENEVDEVDAFNAGLPEEKLDDIGDIDDFNVDGELDDELYDYDVIDEIVDITEFYPTQWIHFVDDTFILDGEWTNEFSYEYRRKVGLPFACNIRPNLVNEEVVRSLKEAGCKTVAFGIESGDEYLRNTVLKRNISDVSIIETSEILKKYKIRFIAENMLGIPEEKLMDIYKTLEL